MTEDEPGEWKRRPVFKRGPASFVVLHGPYAFTRHFIGPGSGLTGGGRDAVEIDHEFMLCRLL